MGDKSSRMYPIIIGISILILIIAAFVINEMNSNDINESVIYKVNGKVYIPTIRANQHYDSGIGIDGIICEKFCLNDDQLKEALDYVSNTDIWLPFSDTTIKDSESLDTWNFILSSSTILNSDTINIKNNLYCIYNFKSNSFVSAFNICPSGDFNVAIFILDKNSGEYYYIHANS